MISIKKIKQYFKDRSMVVPAAGGYDKWAEAYDDQPDNLMLALDEFIFSELLQQVPVAGSTIVDVGCGTGRHWQKIMDKAPLQLTGYDVSKGMLDKLQEKFPPAQTHLLLDDRLQQTAPLSCDMIISTLTIAHIADAAAALHEWDRVLKPGGYVLLTDYHPAILQKGGLRTFTYNGKTMAVKNYVHPLSKIKETAGQLHWNLLRLTERIVDEEVKPFYEKQQALPVFEKYKGLPVIYGMLFKKQ